MVHVLDPHPDTPCPAIRTITVEVKRGPDALALRYTLTGGIAALAVPEPVSPARTDGLWRTTCFEAFLTVEPPHYREFNLSSSGAWAAYAFDDYRVGMVELETAAPQIALERYANRLSLSATIPCHNRRAMRLGLSAVIETLDGAKSYWALAHPPGPPDFHHRDCFALELPPPPQP